MRRKLVIELQIDADTHDHNEAVDDLMSIHAVQILAAATLLNEDQRPQVVCYADDFYKGRIEIEFLARRLPVALVQTVSQDEGLSDDLVAALQDMRKGD
jgi:hypothetical protein